MKKTLWSRLILCYLISVVLVFVLLNTYGMNLLEKELQRDKETQLYKQANLISNEYMGNFYDDTTINLHEQLKSIDTYLDIRVWIVNAAGDIIVDSAYKNPPQFNLTEYDPSFLDKSTSENIIIRGVINEPMLSYTKTVTYDYRIMGYIVLFTPHSEIRNNALLYIDVINICFLIFFPLLLLIFLYIYYITASPMKRLIKASMEYSAGNFNYNLIVKGLSEYQELGHAVAYMAGELNKLDDYQKKFVANISHDFRSPLTSIKGFAEAILDGTIPYEMQDKYLNIILFETERLNKLTSSLLELNSFENHGAFLDIISFDINHIIKKTSESFEGVCRDKKITLNLVFSSKETYVDADMSKIQQVLYNLIDNAIKFSHNNSKIKVSTEEKGDKVFISVKDYGIGIPKDSIKKIWDRFYKTDASRGKDKKGTGLGLSIAKEIIQSHNENINVISTEGVGTEFIFSLKKSPE
ncbi:HAMP domain-containing histidine kinase [Mobilitalea sibirica]|uniref:histidine kinase n=1 Tax=Mobilitalea sibirica TaxID=1462919 RepID=A0A8J7H251_9FIRM|nr:HAMP domain-containing sensor histidine kinase [Mobilitalea sibirica]MBH1940754.1 HAMP domain-containing histidine kinase [Mobilitalea sibirica]